MKTFICVCIACLLYQAAPAQNSARQIKIENGQVYLNFPVKESNKQARARIECEGKLLDQFTIRLATENPDYWVFFDAAAYQGKTLTVEISREDGSPSGALSDTQAGASLNNEANENRTKGLKLVFASANFPGQETVYKEVNRPQVHFSARRGWINDPNGLIYYNGEYHMYFQHNPYGWAWGNMHWGHAVSKDLVHWKELAEAIYPFNERDAAFSGSAIIDPKNTSGFRKDGIDPLIVVYTSTGRGECLKLSYDNGRTFTDYEGNPILAHRGRDPRVFWYEHGNHWVMVVWDYSKTKKMSLGQEAVINQNLIYTSPDLKNWTEQSGVAGFFECPELFELPVEGHPGVSKWVMYDATGRYLVGDFDGKNFSIDQHLKKYVYGGGYFYASQTFSNTPDRRRIQVGWGRDITHPGMPFNQALLFPTELKLKNTADGLRLCPAPIKEISSLQTNTQTFENKILKANDSVSATVNGDAVQVIAEFEKGDARFALNVLGYELSYNDLLGEFTTTLKEHTSVTDYVKPYTETFKIEAIVDKNILEVFVNDGELYYVMPFEGPKNGKISAFTKGSPNNRKTILKRMEVSELRSIWTNPNSPSVRWE